MKAQTIIGAIPVDFEVVLDGQLVIETGCQDYDHYKKLPNVVGYKGLELKKTGWSSDTNKACYKQSKAIAHKVG